MWRTLVRTAFLVVLYSRLAGAKRDFVIHIQDVNCTQRSNIMNITCGVTKSHRVTGLNVLMHFNEDVNEMRYSLNLQHFSRTGEWQNFFNFTHLDICEFLGAKFTVPVLLLVRTMMKRFSNLPDGCPLLKGKSYYIQGMKFDPEQFPSYLPEGRFMAVGDVFNDEYLFADYHFGVVIARKKNLKVHKKDSMM